MRFQGRGEVFYFALALIINLIIAVLYLIMSLFHKKKLRRDCLIRFIVMLLCPVVAEGFFFFSWLFFRVLFHREVDLADVIFSKERGRTFRKADEQTESNLVPLEEAMAVTDRTNTRILMMDVIRRDISDTLKTISLSLESDDSEVSHYGASILQSALGDFRKQVQKLDEHIKNQEEDWKTTKDEDTEKSLIKNERELLKDLNLVLRQHVLAGHEQTQYVEMMDGIAELLKEHTPPSAKELEWLCSRELELGNTKRCRYWAELSEQQWPDYLSSYTNELKLYYQTGEREAFFKKLDALKATDIVIDHQTLEVIRLFQEPETK